MRLVGGRRAGRFDTRDLRGLIVLRKRRRQVRPVRSGGLHLLAQHAKTAIPQKFSTAAEQRRSRKRDQPAPIRARKRPADGDPGEGLPPGKGADELAAAVEFGAAEQGLDGLAAMRRVCADRSGERGMGRAKTAVFVKRPQEARIQRRRSAHIRRRGFLRRRSVATVSGRRRHGARGAEGRNRRQKPRRARRRGDAGAAQIDVDPPPFDDETHALEPRRLADGERRRQMAQAPRARSLAPQQPRFERVRVVDLEQREHGRARGDDPRRRELRSPAARCRRASPAAPAAGRKPRLPHATGPRVQGRTAAASGSKSALVNDNATGAGGGRWGRRLGLYR